MRWLEFLQPEARAEHTLRRRTMISIVASAQARNVYGMPFLTKSVAHANSGPQGFMDERCWLHGLLAAE